jgi:hypothetical protein
VVFSRMCPWLFFSLMGKVVLVVVTSDLLVCVSLVMLRGLCSYSYSRSKRQLGWNILLELVFVFRGFLPEDGDSPDSETLFEIKLGLWIVSQPQSLY